MDLGLKGRTALVTGSSRGLGFEIAKHLAQEGVRIILTSRNTDRLHFAKRDMRKWTDQIPFSFPADAIEPEDILALFAFIKSSVGQLDILVNNTGNIETFGAFEDLKEDDWLESFDLTFMSAVRFINASLPYLRKSDQARIINISSLSSHQPGSFNPHYSIAKSALNNLTKHLANYLGKDKITVNAVCPSTLAGGGWHQNIISRAKRENITSDKAEELMRREECRKSPLGAIGTLEDVANKVVFLASSKASFLTGHIYNVDGGITRSV